MNRLPVLLITSVLCLGFAKPAPAAELPSRASVTYERVKIEDATLAKDRRTVEGVFEARELTDLSESFRPLLKRLDVDQFLVSPGFTRAVFIRYGVKPLKPYDTGTVLNVNETQFVYHAKTASGVPFAALFVGYGKRDINPLLFEMTHSSRARSSAREAAFRFLIGNSARADLVCDNRDLYGKLKGTARSIKNNKMLCLKKAVWGAVETQGALFSAIYNYDQLGKTWEAMKDLWENMEVAFQENYEGFFNLPEADQAEIACDVFGSVLSTAVLAGLSKGVSVTSSAVGLGKKMATLSLKITEKVAAAAKAGKSGTQTAAKLAAGTVKTLSESKLRYAAQGAAISRTVSDKFENSRCVPPDQVHLLERSSASDGKATGPVK